MKYVARKNLVSLCSRWQQQAASTGRLDFLSVDQMQPKKPPHHITDSLHSAWTHLTVSEASPVSGTGPQWKPEEYLTNDVWLKRGS